MHSLQPFLLCSKLVDQEITRSVCPEGDEFIEVSIGLALLERVKADPATLPFRMLVGRLHNSGFRQTHLAEAFGIDAKSVKRYADAVRDGTPEALQTNRGNSLGHKNDSPGNRPLRHHAIPGASRQG